MITKASMHGLKVCEYVWDIFGDKASLVTLTLLETPRINPKETKNIYFCSGFRELLSVNVLLLSTQPSPFLDNWNKKYPELVYFIIYIFKVN